MKEEGWICRVVAEKRVQQEGDRLHVKYSGGRRMTKNKEK